MSCFHRLVFLTFGLIFGVFVSGCATGPTTPRLETPAKKAAELGPASPAAKKEFAQAQALFKAKDWQKAIARLKKFIQSHSNTYLSSEAWFLLGHSYSQLNAWPQAYQSFMGVIRNPWISPRETEASLFAAQAANRVGQPLDALSVLDWAEAEGKVAPNNLIALRSRLTANQVLGRNLDYLKLSSQLANHPEASPGEKDLARNQAIDFVNSKATEADLELIRNDVSMGTLRFYAGMKLANAAIEGRDLFKARGLLSNLVNDDPAHELADRAKVLVEQIDARSRINSKTIGVVLPLTGEQAPMGYRALRGIQHGLSTFGQGAGIRLAVIDSEGNADVARRGVERLVLEDHVIGIIGGLLSKTASVEASKAQEYGVPVILLSQKSGLTQTGDYVFRNAITSQSVTEQVVRSAMAVNGMKRFAILFPNDPYGVEYANLFWDEVKSRGGEIVAAQTYDPKETDFRSYVQRLVGMFYAEDRDEELRLLVRQQQDKAAKNKKLPTRKDSGDIQDLLPPIVDFDAIFIPDSPKVVGLIAPMLAYNDIRSVRLIGTNIWNSTSLVTRGEKNVESAIFADALVQGDRSFANSEFFSSFKGVFGEDPGFFELQGYESALILRQLIAAGETTRIGLQQKLAGLQKFPSPTGYLNMSPNRELLRRLTPLTVRNGQIVPSEISVN